MKKTVKFILVAIGVLLIPAMWSCSDDNDDFWEEDVMFFDLPSGAQSFVSEFYTGLRIERVEKEYDDGELLYEVELSNGDEITFSSDGRWLQVEAPDGRSIPYGIVPAGIRDYLYRYYEGYGVNDITRTGYGYEVELTSGLDMKFDSYCNLIGIDD